MFDEWSSRRLITMTVLVAIIGMVPLASIAYFRFFQISRRAPIWAERAQASHQLGSASACGGATSEAQAIIDLRKWQEALMVLTEEHRSGDDETFRGHLLSLRDTVDTARRGPAGSARVWRRTHCAEISQVAARAMERAVAQGLDPSSHANRYEDRGIRDITTYLLLWMCFASVLLWQVRRAVVRPAQKLERVLLRVADGDFTADLPVAQGRAMQRLTAVIRDTVAEAQRRDVLRKARLIEQRNVLRRLVDYSNKPLFVIGLHGATEPRTLDYLNDAALSLLGCDRESSEGEPLRLTAVGARIDELAARFLLERTDEVIGNTPGGPEANSVSDGDRGIDSMSGAAAGEALPAGAPDGTLKWTLVRSAEGSVSRVIVAVHDGHILRSDTGAV